MADRKQRSARASMSQRERDGEHDGDVNEYLTVGNDDLLARLLRHHGTDVGAHQVTEVDVSGSPD